MTLPEQSYTVGICVDSTSSLWRETAASPGAALDAALAKRLHNNPDDPPTHFVVTPDRRS
jgi:hypothetical protein